MRQGENLMMDNHSEVSSSIVSAKTCVSAMFHVKSVGLCHTSFDLLSLLSGYINLSIVALVSTLLYWVPVSLLE